MQTYGKVGTMPVVKRLAVVIWLIVSAVFANMVSFAASVSDVKS